MAQRPIAVVVHDLGSGGVQRVMCNLALGLAELGEEVHVLTPDRSGRDSAPLGSDLDVRGLVGAPIGGLPGLLAYVAAERPSGIVSAVTRTNLASLLAARLAGPRPTVILTKHIPLSHLLAKRRHSAALVRRLIAFAYPRADAIVAVSRGVAEDLARTAGIDRSKIDVIPNPVISQDLFDAATAGPGHPWFDADGPSVILGMGRLEPQKDFATLLEAFARLRRHSAAKLAILGEGSERGRLEHLARQLGVTNDVWMPGHVPNPYGYLRRARAFALSSRFEGLPTVLIEALALGTPVVSTDCPAGPREILQGGALGRLVPVGDAAAMAGALASLLDEPLDARSSAVDLSRYTRRVSAEAYRRLLGARGGELRS